MDALRWWKDGWGCYAKLGTKSAWAGKKENNDLALVAGFNNVDLGIN